MLKVRPVLRSSFKSRISGPMTRSRSASRSRLGLGPDFQVDYLCPGLDCRSRSTSPGRSKKSRSSRSRCTTGRCPSRKKSRVCKCISLKTRSRPPTYILTIMGKILYRRLKRNSLFTRGVDLVRQISSCSLLGWGGGILRNVSSATLTGKGNCNGSCSQNKINTDLSPSATKSKNPPPSRESSETCALNINVNAKSAQSSGQDLKLTTPTRVNRVERLKARHSNKTRHKVRKVVRHRGLVARSMGGPKLREQIRVKDKLKGKSYCPVGKRKKRKIKRKFSLEQVTCPFFNMDKKDIGSGDVTQEYHLPGLLLNKGKKFRSTCDRDECATTSCYSRSKSPETSVTQERGKTRSGTVKLAKGKVQKWRALLSFGKMGTGNRIAGQEKKKRVERKVSEQKEKPVHAEVHNDSQPCPSSELDHTKVISPDTSEWPYLPVAARTKGYTKETVTEIVKSKHSASVTKMTKKRWADIVSRSIKEPTTTMKSAQVKEKKNPPGDLNIQTKTWASVAAGDTLPVENVFRKQPESRMEQKVDPVCPVAASGSGTSGVLKKKKKKLECGLTCTDRIWLTCQKSKGTSHVQNFYRKHFGEGKSKMPKRKGNSASPRRKSWEKRRERPQPDRQIAVSSFPSSSRECDSKPSVSAKPQVRREAHPRCTSSNRDCEGQNACLVDNMPVIYTKKAGMVITLNESSHDRPTHKNVNKCNNRVEGGPPGRIPARRRKVTSDDSLEFSSISGTDLCSQLSSITFHSPTTSCLTFTESSMSSKARKPANAQTSSGPNKRLHITAQELSQSDSMPGRPKKISLGYRALLRDSSGPLNARAVCDIHTRNRRADTLQDDKVATRAMRRRLRAERQNTRHNLRRTPARSTHQPCEQTHQPGPFSRPQETGHKQPDQTRCRGPKEGKHSNTGAFSKTSTGTYNLLKSSSNRTTGQAGSTSSCTSTEGDVVWRPTDTDTANNARPAARTREASARTNLMTFRNHPSILTPPIVKSAPLLTEHVNDMSLDLNPILHTLDINWWNAYLHQVDDPPT